MTTHTSAEVGRKAFHLQSIEIKEGVATLSIIVVIDNAPEEWVVEYVPPSAFIPVVEALAEVCPMHMVGFETDEEGLKLADARTVWGYVCPCGL